MTKTTRICGVLIDLEAVTMMRKLGAGFEELASFLRVEVSDLSRWAHTDPDLAEAMQAGGVYADARVADSLYKCATGYEVERVKVVDGVPFKVKEPVLADPKAAATWLAKRRPVEWGEKRELRIGEIKGDRESATQELNDRWDRFIAARPAKSISGDPVE